ncbi:hypothetical protein H5968_13070 [Sphaerospermopsis sp. LEGE 00249]|uniref:hypothetical protein n=1 Tax=Sphaerospermopsis sp. LEGE 00249 TaxID=1380707 RepID=UPI00164D3FFA|nr:hypothetical protein [Sphaerospermopsis sp. LEGE 00249]MBC5796053.1 hypothetical protein [Sphaerospermopsis sp. LEGE 00249]
MNYKLFLLLLFITFTSLPVASAHTVKISGDIGGTIHIEPNDNPRAGEPAATWFALTRKGGKVLPLKECDCELAIYAEPHAPEEPALLEPPLKSVDAERYQGIPGADIIFPKPGVYELQLSGKPATAESFRPFELKFQVTVAAGKAIATPQVVENVIEDNQQNNQQQNAVIGFVQPIIIVAILLLSIGILVFVVKTLKRG